jgi:glycosyltransferase involved in cell wall biosynthesis
MFDEPLLDFEQVHFHSKISNEKLLSIYHNTDILLIPLLDCTANNALLEGTACGLPIITNDVGGVKSYTNETFTSYFKKGDATSMIDKILQDFANKKELQNKSKLARSFSEQNLSLEVIGNRLLKLYQDLNE